VATSASGALDDGSTINLVGLFDDEEIGSKLRQGAAGNFMSMEPIFLYILFAYISTTFSHAAG
jgi:aspartyl aminopeptidase